jgi:hypothetical protein
MHEHPLRRARQGALTGEALPLQAAAWLRCKVAQTQAAFQAASPASVAGMDEAGQVAYVLGFLSEYLSPKWQTALAEHYDAQPAGVTPAPGRGVVHAGMGGASPEYQVPQLTASAGGGGGCSSRARAARRARTAQPACGCSQPCPRGKGKGSLLLQV